jgi:hypothetical protein
VGVEGHWRSIPIAWGDQPHTKLKEPTMRILPILMAAAIGTFATATAFAQGGAGSNQPPGQATTTQSSEQQMGNKAGMKMKKAKKTSKKMKKSM